MATQLSKRDGAGGGTQKGATGELPALAGTHEGGSRWQLPFRVTPQAAVYVAFGLVVAYFAVYAPAFATVASLQNIGRQSAAITVLAVGVTVVIIAGQIDLSVGSQVSMVGVIAALMLEHNINPVVVVVAAIAIGAATGLVNGLITALLGVPSFLVTLGMLEVLSAIAQMLSSENAIPISSTSFYNVFGSNDIVGVPITVLWGLGGVLAGVAILRWTVLGRWVYATGGGRRAAVSSGVPVRTVTVAVFVIAGIAAAMSGLLFAGRFAAGDPTIGDGLELTAIAAVILGGTDLFGGRGTVMGTVVGSVFLGVVSIGLVLMGVGAQMQVLLTGVIIIAAVSINRIGSVAGGARS